MDTFLQDLRFGWRQLRRTPGFTTAAVLALALGIGATTAVFTVLDRVVLQPLPYPDADRLAMVWETNDAKGLSHERISPVNFVDYRGLTQVFDAAAVWWYPQLTLTETGRDPLRVNAIETTPNFFAVLGVQPLMGAGFPEAPAFSRENIAVISHRLWRERFNGDPAIVGTSIALNGPLFTVVGVMPPGFQYPNDTDVWHRLTWDVAQHSRGAHFMESVVRLKPGMTIEAANAELRALTKRLGAENPSTNGEYSARAVPLATEIVGFFRPALFALFVAAAFLLVITCSNVASLLLARATVREREVAVRSAIGASRGRLVQQFLTESLLLAAAGTLLGVLVAAVAVRVLVAASPVELPRLTGAGIDARVLLFAIGLALVTAVAFGVVPALLMAVGDMQRPLKESGRGDAGGARSGVRNVLVVIEIAVAVVLLVGAALFARSFQRLIQQDPGFRSTHAVTARVELPYSYTDFRKIADFYDRALQGLRAEGGVTIAGATNFLPLEAAWRGPFFVQGRPQPRQGDEPQSQNQSIDDDYFRAIGVGLVKGRFFDRRDTGDAPGVVLINETLARWQFPNEDPIGRAIFSPVHVIGPMGRSIMPASLFQIVGVVASVKNATLVRDAEPAIYFSFRQFPFRGMHIVAQGTAEPAALLAAMKASVQRLDPNLPLASARTLDRIVGDATDRPRALMFLMGVFAALALLLSALGIYSVLSYSVNQRRQELSVRMALGAQPRDVLWLVVRQGLWLAMIGGVAGALGALALGRVVSSLLFGVPAADGAAFGTALALAVLTALAACLLPARRAASIDPLAGLRAD